MKSYTNVNGPFVVAGVRVVDCLDLLFDFLTSGCRSGIPILPIVRSDVRKGDGITMYFTFFLSSINPDDDPDVDGSSCRFSDFLPRVYLNRFKGGRAPPQPPSHPPPQPPNGAPNVIVITLLTRTIASVDEDSFTLVPFDPSISIPCELRVDFCEACEIGVF